MSTMRLSDLLFRDERRNKNRESDRVVHEAQEARAEALGILEQARVVHSELMDRIKRDELAPMRRFPVENDRS